MTAEFKISFQYESRNYNARVLKSTEGSRMAYAIRPKSTLLAKGYGPQTLIFKENNRFCCESDICKSTPEYITALITALSEQDISSNNNL